jgi:carboxylesterase type B
METVYTDGDKNVSASMLRMWTDFAKTGQPTPENGEWLKYVLFHFCT